MTGLSMNVLTRQSQMDSSETIALEIDNDGGHVYLLRKFGNNYRLTTWFNPSNRDEWTKHSTRGWRQDEVTEDFVRQYAKFLAGRAEKPSEQ